MPVASAGTRHFYDRGSSGLLRRMLLDAEASTSL